MIQPWCARRNAGAQNGWKSSLGLGVLISEDEMRVGCVEGPRLGEQSRTQSPQAFWRRRENSGIMELFNDFHWSLA